MKRNTFRWVTVATLVINGGFTIATTPKARAQESDYVFTEYAKR